MVTVPDGSIYFWMYEQGLKHVDIHEVELAVAAAGKEVRPKDRVNYWNGFHKSDLYHGPAAEDVFMLSRTMREKAASASFDELDLWQYPPHPYIGLPEVQNRWVPCSESNKPMVKWSKGCMTMADAVAYPGQKYLAENLKGCQFIVIDCDGDHDAELDMETIMFLYRWANDTHCLVKPKLVNQYEGYENTGCTIPASFHLTFATDKLIPTMHFPYANIDIVGNRRNSLRYWKNKSWNGITPVEMSGARWAELQAYVKYRKEKANG